MRGLSNLLPLLKRAKWGELNILARDGEQLRQRPPGQGTLGTLGPCGKALQVEMALDPMFIFKRDPKYNCREVHWVNSQQIC